ncbi:MAG TPA: hypothetical protein VF155_07200 [Candidatus Dormibacteraeota bacterium]
MIAVALATVLPLMGVLGAKALITNGSFDSAGFEIDGNLQKDAGTYDWANAGGSTAPSACSGLSAGSFANPGGPLNLFCAKDSPTGTNDNSISGHEQDTSIQVTCGSIPNGKSDLSTFYVASQSAVPTGGTKAHSFLYLGWTINSIGGSADMDFEFNQLTQPSALQDGTVGHPCPSGNGDTANVGATRSAGDLLVEYQFAAGGNSIAVKLSHWVTSGACATSQAAPCWGPETDLTAANIASAAINDSTTADSFGPLNCPFNGAPKPKQQTGCVNNPLDSNNNNGILGPDQFGETAIDLTNALNSSSCETFGSAYLKSRSSAVFTDAVKDYIAPVPVHITNCVTPTIATSLSGSTATFGGTVTDTATISNFLGSNPPGGTVAFNVYKGSTSSSCIAGNLAETVPTGAGSDGSNGDTFTAGANNTASATDTITSAGGLVPGSYEVQAVYTGDGGQNLKSSSNCGDEPLTINKKTPTLATQDSPTTDITVGTATTVSDTVTFSGLVSGVFPASTSTVTFTLYSDGSCTNAVSGVTATVNPSGSSSSVGSGDLSFTPTATGTYTWGVSFSGDSNYNKVPSSGVQCGGTNETLTVVNATPSLVTQIALEDKVTISGGNSPTGTVTFQLYDTSDCSGTLVAHWDNVAISSGVASTVGVTPTSGAGSNFVSSGKTYSWKVTYNGNSTNNSVTVGCNATNGDQENAAITYTP